MITLDTQNFLSPELSIKLMEAGVDMSDSRYVILSGKCVIPRDEKVSGKFDITPTYTLPELLYKLPEYVPEYGKLTFIKDAPFYCFNIGEAEKTECVSEYPIEAAGYLLLECAKNRDLWYVKDISGK